MVDDGIAMGSTMHTAVELCRKKGAKKIIIAVPVAGRQVIQKFSKMADEVIVLESPVNFYAKIILRTFGASAWDTCAS